MEGGEEADGVADGAARLYGLDDEVQYGLVGKHILAPGEDVIEVVSDQIILFIRDVGQYVGVEAEGD